MFYFASNNHNPPLCEKNANGLSLKTTQPLKHTTSYTERFRIILAEEQGTLASRPYRGPVISLLVAAGASSVFSACRGATFILMGGRIAKRLRCRLGQRPVLVKVLPRKWPMEKQKKQSQSHFVTMKS